MPVACMAAMAMDTLSAAAMWDDGGHSLNTATPIRADMTCPPSTLRGWAKGTDGAPKSSMDDAPNVLISSRLSVRPNRS